MFAAPDAAIIKSDADVKALIKRPQFNLCIDTGRNWCDDKANISPRAVEKLCEFLATVETPSLEILFKCTDYNDEISAAAASNPSLETLEIYNPGCYIINAELVIESLVANTTLQSLSLMNFCCRGGIEEFFDALAHNKSLKRLSMDGCSLKGKDNALAAGLAANDTLESISFVDCNMYEIDQLVASIAANTTLQRVDLSYNPIGPVRAQALLDMPETHPSLTEVVIEKSCCFYYCELECLSRV